MAKIWEQRLENYYVYRDEDGTDTLGDVKRFIKYSYGWVPSGSIVFESTVYPVPDGEKIGEFGDLDSAKEAVELRCANG